MVRDSAATQGIFAGYLQKIELKRRPVLQDAGGHNHPNNYLSGVYYAQVQPGADTINFHDPRAQTGVIRPPVTELVAANADQAVVRVRGRRGWNPYP